MFSSVGVVALLSSLFALALPFSDMEGSPHMTAVSYLYEKGIINGYSDNTFRPEDSINRAELLKILVNAKGIAPTLDQYQDCFPDVTNEWFAPFVCYAKNQGWVSGYEDGNFLPGKSVNMAEALKMTLNTLWSKSVQATEIPYTDVDPEAWYAPYVHNAYNGGLLDWVTGTTLGIGDDMTRGNMSEIIYRILYVPEQQSSSTSSTTSVSRSISSTTTETTTHRSGGGSGGGGGGGASPVCGNSSVEGDETCDDGNAVTESCTYGQTSCSVCNFICRTVAGSVSYCGDSLIDAGNAEACDDGNTSSNDGCSATCTTETGYSCSGTPSTCVAICGDGLKKGSEGCDDHNTSNGDGCSASCVVESGYSCVGTAPSVCTPVDVCGDGVKTSGEACDDHNTSNGDGCSSSCTVESGYSCSGSAPSSCSATCGDGIRVGAEQCDDHNVISGDGCDANCTPTACGNGIVTEGEACDDGNHTNGDGCDNNCTPTACGNGIVDPGETCDDGNVMNGDGCSATCTLDEA